ncbi:hypothetical protein E4U53_006480 [Claviceps sorghi]|nr:hypothetical protein E4U53_006480 [Claviceps sorghi]
MTKNRDLNGTDRNITILHYIVSTAQDQFDRSPHPKPLPAAVLFKAYDDILPTFGIDPDSDHHLSALVFRIGGESGTGSLLEKFHALLKRMGILLEFDDDTIISDSSSPFLKYPHEKHLDPLRLTKLKMTQDYVGSHQECLPTVWIAHRAVISTLSQTRKIAVGLRVYSQATILLKRQDHNPKIVYWRMGE